MHRRFFIILVLGGTCLAQVAGIGSGGGTSFQRSTVPAADPNAPKAEVSGQVLDSSTGQPLKKVWITARTPERGRGGSTVSTDAQGHFLLKSLDPGNYMLSAQRSGYVYQLYGQKSGNDRGTPISLAPGQKFADVVFRLVQGGVISGRVVDEYSEPLARVQVQALQFRYAQGRRTLMPMGSGVTDDRGEYRIFGLRPGQAYVRATMRAFGMFVGQGEIADPSAASESTTYPPLFYPNVEDVSQASPLTLRAAQESHADFTMTPQRSYSVSGRLVGASGTSGRTFLMLAKRGDPSIGPGSSGNNTVVRENDTFTFRQVLPGTYNLIAQQQQEGQSASAKIEVDVRNADVQGVVVTLSPPVEVTGHVTFDGNTTAKLSSVRISFTPEDSQGFMRGAFAQSKDDGTFTFQAPPDERYKLSFTVPPKMYLKAASAGREDALERGFSPSASRTLDLQFAVGGTVNGTVKKPEGTGEQGVTVVLVPDIKPAGLVDTSRSATTDENGKYQLVGIRPGSYQAYAFEQMEPGAYEDEEWLRAFASQAQSVKISENGTETLDLKPISANGQP